MDSFQVCHSKLIELIFSFKENEVTGKLLLRLESDKVTTPPGDPMGSYLGKTLYGSRWREREIFFRSGLNCTMNYSCEMMSIKMIIFRVKKVEVVINQVKYQVVLC